MKFAFILALTTLAVAPFQSLAAESFYDDSKPLFSMRPDEKKSSNLIGRFGPVGMGIELIQPAFTMRVHGIEPDSPAAAAGLKPGLIIESINGRKLEKIDPRIQLGNMITEAEAKDGVIKMLVADKPGESTREVVVKIPVLGPYSPTWPMDCPKSDKIVRNMAEYLKAGGAGKSFGSLGMLFLLSTGEEGDLEPVRQWVHGLPTSLKDRPFHTWNAGYGHLALCEYYLRTGDAKALPAIQAVVDYALEAENNGGWGNRSAISGLNYGGGGGHLNAGGVPLATFLILAKECGAKMPDDQLLRIIRHFHRFAGRGGVAYGNGKPEGSYTDNGKNGALAFTMAAAASLSPQGEKSIYAKARDTNARFSFYSTSYMLHGHTGGGIGEIWRSSAMGLLAEKLPVQHRSFMNERRWHYELSRRHDGSFAILGGERYDNPEWGTGYALTYTVPRKTLRLTGAPRSPHSKAFDLPERIWGNTEDDDFVNPEPIAYPDGSKPDFSKETLPEAGGMALQRIAADALADDDLRRHIRNPDFNTRCYFLKAVVQRDLPFLMEMLDSNDARLRRLGLMAIVSAREKFLTPDVFQRVAEMVAKPEESWYVKEHALVVLAAGTPDQIAGQIDTIVPYLEHEEWWLRHSALQAVTPVAADKRVYQKVIPALGRMLRSNHHMNVAGTIRWGALPGILRQAEPEIAELARKEFGEAYASFIEFQHSMPDVSDRVNDGMRAEIAHSLTKVPGGYDVLFQIAKQRSPSANLPYEDLFLEADPSDFSPELRAEVANLVKTRLIPRYIGKNRDLLLRELANEAIPGGFYYREPRLFELVSLFQRMGIKDYDWRDFGPEMAAMKWHYHSFDPPETQAWDVDKPRFRKITLPAGFEKWTDPAFDPAQCGWKDGLQPFGATHGKLAKPGACPLDFCRHGLPMQTLWEKEVQLLRGKFKFPELKDGHRYRLVVGGMSHVGAGEGFNIHLNGKPFFSRERGVGRREGSMPISAHIDKSWWPEFAKGEVDLAVMSFMGVHKGTKSRHLSIWIQEMKIPDLGPEVILHSATLVPMESTAWQALQDLDNNDLDPEVGKFLWDGKFAPVSAQTGRWKSVGIVKSPDAFDPKVRPDSRGIRFKEIELKADGKTASPLMIHSGGVLMDLKTNEALQMQVKSIDGTDYLFIETGGFDTKHGMDWKPQWEVLVRDSGVPGR